MFLDDYGRWNVYFVKDNREILWCRSLDGDAVHEGTHSWEMFGDNGTDPAHVMEFYTTEVETWAASIKTNASTHRARDDMRYVQHFLQQVTWSSHGLTSCLQWRFNPDSNCDCKENTAWSLHGYSNVWYNLNTMHLSPFILSCAVMFVNASL